MIVISNEVAAILGGSLDRGGHDLSEAIENKETE